MAERSSLTPDTDPLCKIIQSIGNGTELIKFKRLLKRGGQNSTSDKLFRARLTMKEVPKGWSPLVAAVQSKRPDILKYILKNFPVNIEQETTFANRGLRRYHDDVHGPQTYPLTALWAASSLGDLKCVKILVAEAGADVDHVCGSPRVSPLWQAVSGKHNDVALFLINNNADVKQPCEDGSRSILFSAINFRERSKELVELLVKKGVSVHCTGDNGNSPLHFARSPEVAKILIDAGARNTVNDSGLTTVVNAALNDCNPLVDYLTGVFQCGPRELYDCYCLQAVLSMLQNDGMAQCRAAAFILKAVQLRLSNPDLFSDLPPANEIYDGIQEPATMIDYITTAQSKTRMLFVCSIYYERIIGQVQSYEQDMFVFCLNNMLEHHCYYKCLQFCHRMLDFRVRPRVTVFSMSDFADDVLVVVEAAATMTEDGFTPSMEPLFQCGLKAIKIDDTDDFYITCVVRLIALWIKIVDECITDSEERDKELSLITNAVQEMVKATGNNGATIVNDSLQDICEYGGKRVAELDIPLEKVLTLFLNLGCSIQCEDGAGDSPLHLAVQLQDTAAVDCVRTLLEYGAHIDAVNSKNQTAKDLLDPSIETHREMLEEIESFEVHPPTLQCLTARAIVQHNIESYREHLPAPMAEFVSWHSSASEQS